MACKYIISSCRPVCTNLRVDAIHPPTAGQGHLHLWAPLCTTVHIPSISQSVSLWIATYQRDALHALLPLPWLPERLPTSRTSFINFIINSPFSIIYICFSIFKQVYRAILGVSLVAYCPNCCAECAKPNLLLAIIQC